MVYGKLLTSNMISNDLKKGGAGHPYVTEIYDK